MASLLDDLLDTQLARLVGAVKGRRVQSRDGGRSAPGVGVQILITGIGDHTDVFVSAITGGLYDRNRCTQNLTGAATLSNAVRQALDTAAALPRAHTDADLARTLGLEVDGSFARPAAALAAE